MSTKTLYAGLSALVLGLLSSQASAAPSVISGTLLTTGLGNNFEETFTLDSSSVVNLNFNGRMNTAGVSNGYTFLRVNGQTVDFSDSQAGDYFDLSRTLELGAGTHTVSVLTTDPLVSLYSNPAVTNFDIAILDGAVTQGTLFTPGLGNNFEETFTLDSTSVVDLNFNGWVDTPGIATGYTFLRVNGQTVDFADSDVNESVDLSRTLELGAGTHTVSVVTSDPVFSLDPNPVLTNFDVTILDGAVTQGTLLTTGIGNNFEETFTLDSTSVVDLNVNGWMSTGGISNGFTFLRVNGETVDVSNSQTGEHFDLSRILELGAGTHTVSVITSDPLIGLDPNPVLTNFDIAIYTESQTETGVPASPAHALHGIGLLSLAGVRIRRTQRHMSG